MKTHYLFSLAVVLMAASSAFGQDLIFTFDSRQIEAKIVEVTGSQVSYRNFSNPDGPVFNIARRDVMTIRYENGEVDGITGADKLRIRGNSAYFIGGRRISRAQAMQLAAPYADVVESIRAGSRLKKAALATGFVGAGILASGYATFIFSNLTYDDPYTGDATRYGDAKMDRIAFGLMGAGVLIGLPSIGLGLASLKAQKRAMTLYNDYTDRVDIPAYEPTLALGFTPGGVGVQLNF